MTPRDLFIFSRRSALARPSEPVPFVFRSVTYTLSRWVHACEAIARPPYYTRGHQRTLRRSALPGLGDHYIRSSSVASCPPRLSVRLCFGTHLFPVCLATMRPWCPLAHPGSVTKYERLSMSFARSYTTSLMYTSVLTAGPTGRSYAVFG